MIIEKVKKVIIMALQLNGKELKDFRVALEKWHVAKFKIADMSITAQRDINNNNDKINTNRGLIEKVNRGEKIIGNKSAKDLQLEIDTWVAQNDKLYEDLAEYKKSQDEYIKAGESLITKELLKAITEYSADIFNDDKHNALLEELRVWFVAQGYNGFVSAKDVESYIRCLGVKLNSNKAMCKTNKHTGGLNEKKIIDTFLGAMCDEPNMAKVLQQYKWANKFDKKTKKSSK